MRPAHVDGSPVCEGTNMSFAQADHTQPLRPFGLARGPSEALSTAVMRTPTSAAVAPHATHSVQWNCRRGG